MTEEAQAPPAVLGSGAVAAWALIDQSVEFTGRLHLYVDGERIGPVPALAVTFEPFSKKYLVHHCDLAWNVFASASDCDSLPDAKALAEQWYAGVGSRWVDTGVTPEQSEDLVRDSWSEFECSFCGRIPPDGLLSVFQGKKANICEKCISEFAAELEEKSGDST